ncbi:DUF1501 domain-containing protein [Luteolibacter sp. GHJ8]|uniref:DUF1501 domain-containing protein n=1 Tax=Luteolibacter rhizosphaerae TaxID=2989719 RepID=A0ABT3G4R9_9BACT|nr:DUF1501 domain-containing protein [Luteolibacter rhizosphaerae]MCW1914856.1 DUF1501 domain-containing protein [Luteolibacter rhizosphaerae]
MKSQDKDSLQNRRSFLRQSACASLGLTGVINTLAHLRLVNSALAQGIPGGDYKALVVLFLFGGNDSNNLLIPRKNHASYAQYKSARGVLKILDETDSAYVAGQPASIPLTGGGATYGVHPAAGGIADLFNGGDLAFVANVGTLVYPTTRAEYNAGSVPLPPQLFSHSDQQVQWQSSVPDQPFSRGWGGRIADLLASQGYAQGQVSLSVSLSGINSLQVADQEVQYAVTPEGAIPLAGYAASGSPYGNALNSDGTYKTTTAGKRLKAFDDITNHTYQHLLDDDHAKVVKRARANEGLVGAALTAAAATGVDFDNLFLNAQSNLGDQLKSIAKLIAGRTALGNSRQIFFASIGGFDTHQDQLDAQTNLLGELGSSLKAFSDTLKALGVNDNVVTITHSDFTRTLTPNGQDAATAGSDHGWGGHQIVLGGPVHGNQIYGSFPSLALGAGLDAGSSNRGRWIPTTSVDQYAAVSANWLGVSPTYLADIFPNLSRFEDPFGSSANLGFL